MQTVIQINPRSEIPVHRQIFDAWREGILTGRFSPGSRVPSTRELAAGLAVARSTVTHAYEQLIAEGYLTTARGSGTYVCSILPEQFMRASASKADDAAIEPPLKLSHFALRVGDDYRYDEATPAGWISFGSWSPDQESFPFSIWRRLIARHLRKPLPEHFAYTQQTQGLAALRREIAEYLSQSRAVRCTPEQVVVVNGSQQALDLCARLLLDPGDTVALEDPGYLGARRIFTAAGAQLQPIRVDAEGLICSGIGSEAKLVYVTPSHQFPTGAAMSLARRQELIEWARRRRSTIIEDDYDSEYRYGGAPLPSLQGIATETPVIYCGTFSKILFPGLRVGYMVAPPTLVPLLRRAKWLSDRNTSMLEQAALADFLHEGHLQRHLRRMRRVYEGRYHALHDALQRYFGPRARILGDAAGMHALVQFDDPDIAARAAARGVRLRSAADYYLHSAPPNQFILGFSTLGERAIREGIRRLAR